MLQPPLSLKTAELPLAKERLVVFRYPLSVGSPPKALPNAEQEIAQLILQGLNNGQIAKHRGTTIRTVANQVAAMYRRFGVHSRVEFVHQLEILASRQEEDGRETK